MLTNRTPASTNLAFKAKVIIVWLFLSGVFLAIGWKLQLKMSAVYDKLPAMIGLQLSPGGFVQGAVLTIGISAISILASLAIGICSALFRLSGKALGVGLSTFYVSFFRGTPLLVQVFLIYLGLPQIGIVVNAVPAGIIALSLNYGAYQSEIVRAGIQAIPSGQREAAAALGLRPWLTMWKIILPQAMRIIVPPTGSQFIAMLKDSSLVSILGVWEIMFLARSYGRAEYRYLEMLLAAAGMYWILSIC